MEQCFPPTPPLPPGTIALHVILLGLAVASIVGLFVKAKRPARFTDLIWWGVAIAAATYLCSLGAKTDERYRPFLAGYMFFVWAVGATGCGVTLIRLSRKGQAVAIIEVLALLAVLGIVILLLLPAVPSAREAAKRTQCKDNLHNLAISMHNSLEVHGHFPDAAAAEGEQPLRSWRVELLPFTGDVTLREKYDDDRPWDAAANLTVSRTRLPWYECPSNRNRPDERGRFYTDYVLPTGAQTMFPQGKGRAAEEIGDGLSNTLLIVEASGLNVVWTEPRDFDVDREPVGVNLCDEARPAHSPGLLSSYHKGGAHATPADGVVRFISEDIDPAVLRALTTANAGDTVGEF